MSVIVSPEKLAAGPATKGIVDPAAADQTLGAGSATHRFASLVASGLATLAETLTSLVRATGVALVLRSDVGASSSDIAVKVGTSETLGGVNSNAILWGTYTGLGTGTETPHVWRTKAGFYLRGGISGTAWGLVERNGGASQQLAFYAGASVFTVLDLTSGFQWFHYGIKIFNSVGSVEGYRIDNGGLTYQLGTDSSLAPGAATINKPSGKSAIASGATAVTITNSLVASGDQVDITWHGDLGTQSKIPWVTTAAGSFTVNVGTAPGSAVAFCWRVSKRI